MDCVEAMALPQKIRWSLRGAPYPAHLRDLLGLDSVLPCRLDNVVRNLVMPATGAERGLTSGVFGFLKFEDVKLQHHKPSRSSRIISEYTLALGGMPSL